MVEVFDMKLFVILSGFMLYASMTASLAQDNYSDMLRSNVAKYRLAVQKNPNDAQAQQSLALALSTSNYRFNKKANVVDANPASISVQEEALVHMQKAVMLQPNHYDWQSALGSDLSNQGRYAEAILHFKKCLHLIGPVKPSDVHPETDPKRYQMAEFAYAAHYSFGDALVKIGRNEEAIVQYHQAMRFYPNEVYVLLGFGNALNGIGDRTKARAVWQKMVALSPKPTYYSRQALVLLAKYPARP
jgi:tetratricopeptide (TPR) repeat protein